MTPKPVENAPSPATPAMPDSTTPATPVTPDATTPPVAPKTPKSHTTMIVISLLILAVLVFVAVVLVRSNRQEQQPNQQNQEETKGFFGRIKDNVQERRETREERREDRQNNTPTPTPEPEPEPTPVDENRTAASVEETTFLSGELTAWMTESDANCTDLTVANFSDETLVDAYANLGVDEAEATAFLAAVDNASADDEIVSQICGTNGLPSATTISDDYRTVFVYGWVAETDTLIEYEPISGLMDGSYTYLPSALDDQPMIYVPVGDGGGLSWSYYQLDPATGSYERLEYCTAQLETDLVTFECSPEYEP